MQQHQMNAIQSDAMNAWKDELWRFAMCHPTAMCVVLHIWNQKLAPGQALNVRDIANKVEVPMLAVHRAIKLLRNIQYAKVVQRGAHKVYIVNARTIANGCN